ncbi:hypothetical protein T07_442 [Trichinella nelsoni]|uniref:Uncharacterized protein n=1 Tax=Trichinella nelsoni TaxID=6336 RepID=A0A0V0RZY5_9BILA|nr:hypothetical protein T07_442 [Trichinella nelsoni]
MEFKTLKFIFGWTCVRELFESFSVLFLVMGDVSELHLVPNRSGSMSLDKEGCKDAIWTNLDVTAMGLVQFGIVLAAVGQ